MFLLFSLPCLQLSFVCPAASRGNLPRSLKLNPLDGMGGGFAFINFPPPSYTHQPVRSDILKDLIYCTCCHHLEVLES